MTTDEAAVQLGLSRRQVLHLIKTGVLQATKRGRDWWIEESAVEEARQRKGQWRNRKEGADKSGA